MLRLVSLKAATLNRGSLLPLKARSRNARSTRILQEIAETTERRGWKAAVSYCAHRPLALGSDGCELKFQVVAIQVNRRPEPARCGPAHLSVLCLRSSVLFRLTA